MSEYALNQQGFQSALAVSTTAVALTPAPAGSRPKHCQIRVIGEPIRWRADGTDPTASVGELVAAGDRITFMDPYYNYVSMIEKFRAIRESSDATLDIIYFD